MGTSVALDKISGLSPMTLSDEKSPRKDGEGEGVGFHVSGVLRCSGEATVRYHRWGILAVQTWMDVRRVGLVCGGVNSCPLVTLVLPRVCYAWSRASL